MFSALKASSPTLKDDSIIEVFFQNNAQLEEFQMRLKPNILGELKRTLNNEYIEIVGKVHEAENLEKPKLLSDKEKFQQMIDKNPALLKLKNKFNLDFE